MPDFAAEQLSRLAARLLAAVGLSAEEAGQVAESLVGANLCGYDSHGVMRLPQYADQIRRGQIVPGAEFEILREENSLLAADGHWGLGQIQAARLAGRLIEKATAAGVAVGTMIHSAHVGRLGEYCEKAVEADLIAMVMVNNHGAVHRVAPPGGKASRLGTNPIAVGIPNPGEPIVIDFCTCVAAEGKVRVLKLAGQPCPDGTLLDAAGHPTNDPNDLYADPPGTILPIGGAQTYKGFALGLMVEIFSGALSGGVCAREVPPNQIGNCVFMMMLDPAHFTTREHFRAEVAGLIAFIRGCPRIDGVERITLPGDPERRRREEKSRRGIALDAGNWAKLAALAADLGVDLPA